MVADCSVQCQTSRTEFDLAITVEKIDAGTLDRFQDSLVFPLHAKQQLSECKAAWDSFVCEGSSHLNVGYVPVYSNGNSPQLRRCEASQT